jgi:hypothetical protein
MTLKNEPPRLKLYNLNLEQQKNLGAIHSYTFSQGNAAGVGLRSAESSLVTFDGIFLQLTKLPVRKET